MEFLTSSVRSDERMTGKVLLEARARTFDRSCELHTFVVLGAGIPAISTDIIIIILFGFGAVLLSIALLAFERAMKRQDPRRKKNARPVAQSVT